MVQWTIVIATGLVSREIRGLSAGHQADFLRIGELLCRYGPQEVGMPHVRPLGDKLWEMRLRDAGGIARAIYFTTGGRRIVVVHAFETRTQRTPRRPLIWRGGYRTWRRSSRRITAFGFITFAVADMSNRSDMRRS